MARDEETQWPDPQPKTCGLVIGAWPSRFSESPMTKSQSTGRAPIPRRDVAIGTWLRYFRAVSAWTFCRIACVEMPYFFSSAPYSPDSVKRSSMAM